MCACISKSNCSVGEKLGKDNKKKEKQESQSKWVSNSLKQKQETDFQVSVL